MSSANPTLVARLVQNGVPRDIAVQALTLTGNDINQAYAYAIDVMNPTPHRAPARRSAPKGPVSRVSGRPICVKCRDDSTDDTLVSFSPGCTHGMCPSCISSMMDEIILVKNRSFVVVRCPLQRCGEFIPFQTAIFPHLSPVAKEFAETIIQNHLPQAHPPPGQLYTLRQLGYAFNADQELRRVDNGGPYFYVNEKHYIEIGYAIVREIQRRLVTHFGCVEEFIDRKKYCNIFRSLTGKKKLMIIIQGSGAVRPGQWARALCFNESLHNGACLDYVDLAQQNGYDVILLNPNHTRARVVEQDPNERYDWYDPVKPGSGPRGHFEPIEGGETGRDHTCTVYDRFIDPLIRDGVVDHLFIVAHSAGGYNTMELLRNRRKILDKLVAIGFTDSVHSLGWGEHKAVLRFVQNHATNWAKSQRRLDTLIQRKGRSNCRVLSAGHHKHENTSGACMESVFKYFEEELAAKLKKRPDPVVLQLRQFQDPTAEDDGDVAMPDDDASDEAMEVDG